MNITIQLMCEGFSKEELQILLQAIRDCEKTNFPQKNLMMLLDVPDLTVDELTDIIQGLKPPFASLKKFKRG